MNRYVRVTAKPAPENPGASLLYFDLVLNENDEIANDDSIFGFQGDIGGNRYGVSFPFILDSRGAVDFGDKRKKDKKSPQGPDPDRWGNCDLRDKPVKLNRELEFSGSGYNEKFHIKEIKGLAGE